MVPAGPDGVSWPSRPSVLRRDRPRLKALGVAKCRWNLTGSGVTVNE